MRRVLIIPDKFRGMDSGAIVTQVLVFLFKKEGFEVAVYSSEFTERTTDDGTLCIPALPFNGFSNIGSRKKRHEKEFNDLLDEYQPTHLFFDGSITNKPLCLLEIGLKRKLHIDVFIFMQDFFCAKLYANNRFAPCTQCLDSLTKAFACPLIPKDKAYLKLFIKQWDRKNLKDLLCKVNHVITSTDEQIGFYRRLGVPETQTYKMPLPFIMNKYVPPQFVRGDYIVGIAQPRIEKGFHLIPQILKYTRNTKVVLAYSNENNVARALLTPGFKKLIEQSKLEVVVASWKSGLSELVASSSGILIPSIWPTTTEYGLLESLAFSKPIVSFNIGVHKEVIEEGTCGFKAECGDFESFAEKLDKLSTLSKEAYEEMIPHLSSLYEEMTSFDILSDHIRNLTE